MHSYICYQEIIKCSSSISVKIIFILQVRKGLHKTHLLIQLISNRDIKFEKKNFFLNEMTDQRDIKKYFKNNNAFPPSNDLSLERNQSGLKRL